MWDKRGRCGAALRFRRSIAWRQIEQNSAWPLAVAQLAASPPPHSPPQPASRRAAAAMPAPMTKMIFPLARWGAAVGAIGAFLLYEEVPQLVLQTTYGVPVTYRDVFEYAGLVAPKPVKTDDE
jgi:hypothetical protein